MRNKTPAIISRQSGVSEVVRHALKVDFWDINEISNKIISVLRYRPLYESLRDSGYSEIQKFSWDVPAEKCIRVYNQLIGKG
jgi:glycosyltransferase involved in cell wall biosynthesis